MRLCVSNLPNSPARECVLYPIIIIQSEVWFINYCLGLGHETMVRAVCLTMFLIAGVITKVNDRKTEPLRYISQSVLFLSRQLFVVLTDDKLIAPIFY